MFQGLEPGVGLVASGWRPVAASGEVSEVGAEGSTTTTEEPGVHLASGSLDPGAPGEGRDRKDRSG